MPWPLVWHSHDPRVSHSLPRGRDGDCPVREGRLSLDCNADDVRRSARGRPAVGETVRAQPGGVRLPQQPCYGKHCLQIMVQIRVVELPGLSVHLPERSVRMVVAQPYLADGALTPQEPFRVAAEAKDRQLEIVKTTTRPRQGGESGLHGHSGVQRTGPRRSRRDRGASTIRGVAYRGDLDWWHRWDWTRMSTHRWLRPITPVWMTSTERNRWKTTNG